MSLPKNVEEFLVTGRIIHVASVTKSGRPHVVPVWYLYEKGKIYIDTKVSTLTSKNIGNEADVELCLGEGTAYYDLKAVIIRGRARRLDLRSHRNLRERLLIKYLSSTDHPAYEPYLEAHDAVLYEIDILSNVAWNNLGLTYGQLM